MAVRHLWKRTQEERRGRRARARVRKRFVYLQLEEASCPVPLTVRGTQTLVSFAPLAFKLFYAARQNAVLQNRND